MTRPLQPGEVWRHTVSGWVWVALRRKEPAKSGEEPGVITLTLVAPEVERGVKLLEESFANDAWQHDALYERLA